MVDDKRPEPQEIGPLLTDIGREMAEVLDRYPEGALLFAEAGDGWSGGAIFIEDESAVRAIKPSAEIFDLVRNVWAIDNLGRSEAEGWVFMEYDVRGGRFHAAFTYRDDVAVGSEYEDWEDAAVAKRFGNKPVIYPPMPASESGQPDEQ